MNWYFSLNLKTFGPIALSALESKAREGLIRPQTLLCQEGSVDWVTAIEVISRSEFPAFQSAESESKLWTILLQDGDAFRQEGPFPEWEIAEMKKAKLINEETLLWAKGLSGWSCLGDRAEFTSPIL